MVRELWLKLTDARVNAALKTLRVAGPALGDLAARPADAAAVFRPVKADLAAALAAGRPASLAAASAAEDFAGRLEKFFSDLALLQLAPDPPVLEALLALQRACGAAGRLLSPGAAETSEQVRRLCAAGRRPLSLARAAAASAPSDFPLNLKFSSIYSGLDAVFDSLERCAEALARL
jgi:hypothetical protein